MAKYNGPVCRQCRREGMKLFLKGERCFTDKCSFDRKGYAPGQHGAGRRGKLSEYAQQLREKQKVRRVYGMMEKPFRNLFDRASRARGQVASEVFFRDLELRLDNVVYRMGFTRSRNESKQFVRHNHILLNGKRCNIPSAKLKVGDVVSVKTSSQSLSLLSLANDLANKRTPVAWLESDRAKFTGKIVAQPTRDDIQLNVKERLIVELYSK